MMGVQGHVVAEQQLEVPAAWLRRDDGDALLPQAGNAPGGRPLHFSRERCGVAEVAVITGANDLRVEVRSCWDPCWAALLQFRADKSQRVSASGQPAPMQRATSLILPSHCQCPLWQGSGCEALCMAHAR